MPKERPYECQLCHAPLAEDELGFACEHIAHGTWHSFFAAKPKRGRPIPDTPCSGCAAAIEAKKKNAESNANIHIMCRACYTNRRARNIDYATAEDVERGYVLVTRAHYEQIVKPEINMAVGPIAEGQVLKLGFSPIPTTWPVALERMWVRVTSVRKGGFIEGSLANHPELFKRKVLKANDMVVFKAAHVLETQLPKAKRSKEPKPIPKQKPEAASKRSKESRTIPREKAGTTKSRSNAPKRTKSGSVRGKR